VSTTPKSVMLVSGRRSQSRGDSDMTTSSVQQRRLTGVASASDTERLSTPEDSGSERSPNPVLNLLPSPMEPSWVGALMLMAMRSSRRRSRGNLPRRRRRRRRNGSRGRRRSRVLKNFRNSWLRP